MASSRPFDPIVSGRATAAANCTAAPAEDDDASLTPPPPSPATPPPAPPPTTAEPRANASTTTATPSTNAPATARKRRGSSCSATFGWAEEKQLPADGAHGRPRVAVRVDVGGDGIIEGWAIRFAFPDGVRVHASDLIGGHLITAVQPSSELLVRARMASGLGTLYMTLGREGGGRRSSARANIPRPVVECVPDATASSDADAGDDDLASDAPWRTSARDDYLWMAKEFNRQYINSHGKEHPDYQPESASDELELHYLNGRLWCFFGAVSNATRSLRAAAALDPQHTLSYLLLAKIRIGQGRHADALDALDAAAATQPQHWQTHLMRLHCLRALGRLGAPEATESHSVVCQHLRQVCLGIKMRDAYELMCDAHARVRLLADDGGGGGGGGGGDGSNNATYPTPAGRGVFGAHLHSAAARHKLAHDRYVVLRNLLPRRLLALLQAFYASLRERADMTAVFQGKTKRHEYLPEAISTYLNLALVPFASSMHGYVVAPTYPFPITYVKGGGIHPHLDVSDNELSLTFQVQLEGPHKAWPLTFLDPRGQQLSALNADDAKQVVLSDNDGILYYGPDIVHWREPQQSQLTQIVFAFREEDEAHCNNQ